MEGVCQQHPDHGQRLEPRHGTVFLLAALLYCVTCQGMLCQCGHNGHPDVLWHMKHEVRAGLGYFFFCDVHSELKCSASQFPSSFSIPVCMIVLILLHFCDCSACFKVCILCTIVTTCHNGEINFSTLRLGVATWFRTSDYQTPSR